MELTLSDLPLLVMLSQVYCAPLLAFEPLLIDPLFTRILAERLDLRNFG